MNRRCPNCGRRNDTGSTLCASCGHVHVPARVVLTSARTGSPLRMHVTTTVGHRLLKSVVGSEARFAGEPQFRIVKDPAIGWVVAHEPDAADGATVVRLG